jgi:type I restriction enzyme S subunit
MELIELGNECEIITKGTTPTTLGKSFTTIGVGFLRAQNVINSNVLIDEDILYIDDETHNNELKRSQIFDGDVLLTIAGTIGRTAIVKNINIQLNCNQAVAIIRLGDSKINKEYLCHFIASPNAQEQFFKGMVTATIANLSLAQIRKLKIPLPPLPQQQKIANILDAADALRQNDKELIAKYDELTQALFLDMFGDPVSNPKGWEMIIMTNVCEKISVGFVGVCEPHYTDKDNGIPMLRTGNLGEGFLKYDKMKYVTEEFHLKQKKSRLFKDDILIARHGDNGKAVLYKGEYQEANCLNIIILRPAKGLLNGTYNVYMLNNESTRNKILGKTGGATQKVVNTKEIQKLIVPIPPIVLQNQFAERVAVIEEQKAIAQKSIEKSESLFNSLLQKAFKGELL